MDGHPRVDMPTGSAFSASVCSALVSFSRLRTLGYSDCSYPTDEKTGTETKKGTQGYLGGKLQSQTSHPGNLCYGGRKLKGG